MKRLVATLVFSLLSLSILYYLLRQRNFHVSTSIIHVKRTNSTQHSTEQSEKATVPSKSTNQIVRGIQPAKQAVPSTIQPVHTAQSLTQPFPKTETIATNQPISSITTKQTHTTINQSGSRTIHRYVDGRPTKDFEIPTSYKDRKIILWYVPVQYINNTPSLEPLKLCPERNCFMTTNKDKYMKDAAAVLFNVRKMTIPMPMARPNPNQIWIAHDAEPLDDHFEAWARNNVFRNIHWRGMFNWTMFYLDDSDILGHYGKVREKTKIERHPRDLDGLVRKKTKSIAWMVGSCDNSGKRMEYVRSLQKYVNVDIYGSCGKWWPRNEDDSFMHMINSTYKFYLAFESSMCEDYITEKFFRYFQADLVLVVRGGANYTKFAPPGTYINTADFKSVKDLGDYLKFLIENHDEYMKILRNKDRYLSEYEPMRTVSDNVVIYTHYQYESPSMCEICYRVNNLEKYSKTIERIDQWVDKKLCHVPTDLQAGPDYMSHLLVLTCLFYCY